MAGFHTNLTIDGFSYYSGNFPPEISGNFRTYNLNGCDMVYGQLLCSTAVASLIMMLLITYLVCCFVCRRCMPSYISNTDEVNLQRTL